MGVRILRGISGSRSEKKAEPTWNSCQTRADLDQRRLGGFIGCCQTVDLLLEGLDQRHGYLPSFLQNYLVYNGSLTFLQEKKMVQQLEYEGS